MMGRSLALLCLLTGLWAGPVPADPAAALAALERCLGGQPTGAISCPPLAGHLDEALKDAIQPAPAEAMEPAQWRDLQAALASFRAPAPRHRLDFDALAVILDETLIPLEEEPGWWQRFLLWLNQWLGQGERTEASWLAEWLEQWDVPEGLIKGVLYGAMALVILLMFYVLGSAVASVRLPRRGPRQPETAGDPAPASTIPDWRQLGELPMARLPAAALQFALGRLTEQGLLPRDPSLTNGQQARLLSQADPALGGDFRKLVRWAEDSVYGGREPPASAREPLLALAAGLGQVETPRE